jgi:ABC-type bacteriocin/lantibiotic exporter with double-glycine peptidase domain
MSRVIVVTPATTTVRETFSTSITMVTSIFATSTSSALPVDGVVVSTTVEIIISLIITILIFAIGLISLQFSRTLKKQDSRNRMEALKDVIST